MRHSRILLFAGAAMLLLVPPAPSVAQERGLRLTPYAGAYRPLSHSEFMDVATLPLLGVRLESAGHLRLRASAAMTTRGTARQNAFCLAVRPGPCPPLEAALRVETGSADLALNVLRSGPIRPYVLAGGGVKRYSFGGDRADAFGGARTDVALQMGGGVQARLGRVNVVAEAADLVSRFRPDGWSQRFTQHDLALTMGVRLGL